MRSIHVKSKTSISPSRNQHSHFNRNYSMHPSTKHQIPFRKQNLSQLRCTSLFRFHINKQRKTRNRRRYERIMQNTSIRVFAFLHQQLEYSPKYLPTEAKEGIIHKRPSVCKKKTSTHHNKRNQAQNSKKKQAWLRM